MIPCDDKFSALVADAYEHLFDLVYLRTHPLLARLVPEPQGSPKERAWQLHQLLLDTITALDPGPAAPSQSRAKRRHRLMALRYQEGLDVQALAQELGIGRRHYFREHKEAIAATASLLAVSEANQPAFPAPGPPTAPPGDLDRLEALRLEAARLARSSHQVDLAEVVQGATKIAQEMAWQSACCIRLELAPGLPLVAADRNTLRQLLLSLLSHLLASLHNGEVLIGGKEAKGRVVLSLIASGNTVPSQSDAGEAQTRLSMLNELAAVQSVRVRSLAEQGLAGFALDLPTAQTRTVLVVDDNGDTLQLFQHYLSRHNYQVVTAQAAAEAIGKARELQPFAVTLDLMMPGRDGWDVLQTLANQAATKHIPVIICTVVAAKEMALSLGAAAFLAKPVSEQALAEALAALE